VRGRRASIVCRTHHGKSAMLVDVRGCYVTSFSGPFGFRELHVIGYDVGRTGQCLKQLKFCECGEDCRGFHIM
jgi:hypothetical protein